MNTRNKIITISLLLILLINCGASTRVDGAPIAEASSIERPGNSETGNKPASINVLNQDEQGITFLVQIPWKELQQEEVFVDGKTYIDLSLSDWLETDAPGSPQLPYLTEQLGAPIGSEISVSVIPGKSHEYSLTHPLLPSATVRAVYPTLEFASEKFSVSETTSILEMDPAVYRQDQVYPGQMASVSADGFLRQQRVVGINLFPVQVLPSKNTLVIYESLEVKVSFSGSSVPFRNEIKPEANTYEQLFRSTLLNYDTARQWRIDQSDSIGLDGEFLAGNAVLPWSPPNPGWRIKTTAEGIHKITYSELEAAGVPVSSLDPQSIQLFNEGTEVAVQIVGEEDGNFDESDFILFFARIFNTKYSAENVYWLTYGSTPGIRMAEVDGTPSEQEIPTSFLQTKHIEKNLYYVSQAPGDDRFDRWMGDYASSTKSSTQFFDLVSPAASEALLNIALLGYTDLAHTFVIKVNEVDLGTYMFTGKIYQIFEVDVPGGVLVAGQNKIEITTSETGIPFFLDWVDMTYESGFSSEQDRLTFDYNTPGIFNFQIEGFTSGLISVYEITDVTLVKEVVGGQVFDTGGLFTMSYQGNIDEDKKYSLVENSAFLSVKAIEQDVSSDLGSITNEADYIVITPTIFNAQAEILSLYRSEQGLRTMVVNLQDIYDQFGYGYQDVNFVRDFLSYAYHNWEAPAPAFVVLFGDGNQDPKGYISTSLPNHMPSYLAATDPWLGETAADNRYVTFIGGDLLPDMMLGRLTAGDVTEAEILVNKLLSYEETPPDSWKQRVLLVADDPDFAGNFTQISEDLIDCCLPDIYTPEKVYFKETHPDESTARAAIINIVNQGALITNYIGHASRVQWTDEGVFRMSDISNLVNADRLTVVLSMTCLDGQYQRHQAGTNNRSMAEIITGTAGKGAVASWSPTGLGVSNGHDHLNRGFFEAVFINGSGTIGEGTTAGKFDLWSTGTHPDLLDTYLLFGDPATRLALVYRPEVSSIPDQAIYEGQSFTNINLDNYVVDYDNADDELTWSYTGNADLLVSIVDRMASITIPNAFWTGTEAITFRATDLQGYFAETTANFSVLSWPSRNWLPMIIN